MASAPLFKPFRALGYITEDLPFAVQRMGKETFVTVSVGRAWQVYNCAKLNLILVGPQLRGDIRALACKRDLTFAAVGRDVVVCKRVHRCGLYCGAAEHGKVVQLLVLGDLLLVLHARGFLVVWQLGQYEEPKAVLQLGGGAEFGSPTCMVHPDTYLNKVLVGGSGGQMQLWNFSSGQLLHTFPGWGSAICTLCSSPALDVVAAGLADGRAMVHNIRYDRPVVAFGNASGVGLGDEGLLGGGQGRPRSGGAGGACTAISFRTGGGLPLMAAGGGAGVVTLWNLEERKLHAVLRDAHDGPLLSLHFFAGEPVLMSSAADNSIKQWVFDGPGEPGRLLRFRSGHSAPPTSILHYGEGQRLLSAGRDRAFRVFSVIQDQQSRELSQRPGGGAAKRAKQLGIKKEELKLTRVVGMAAGEVRERDWCNVITAHEGDASAYVWRLQHFTIGEHRLRPPPEAKQQQQQLGNGRKQTPVPDAPVTCVAVSPCGNFGLVGSAAGRVDRYNMQSGLHRGTYGRAVLSKEGRAAKTEQGEELLRPAHDGAVVGVAVDSCNHLMVTGGFDKMLRVWNFKSMKLVSELSAGSPITHVHLHPGSALCAAACDDLTVRVFDVEAGRLVRRFKGHKDRITCLQLSSDSRWLLSASMDGTLVAWDVPAARCLQVMSLGGSPVTSLSLSPALDLLATTHSDLRGIYLWSNQAVFGNPADILHGDELVEVGMPDLSGGLPQDEGLEGDATAAADGGEQEGATGRGVRLEAPDSEEEEADEEGSSGAGAAAAAAARTAARRAAAGAAAAASVAAAAAATYERRDAATGAPSPLAPSLVTLSLLPRAQWQSLVHLEAIKARNKPIEPPKKPEAAPFFLPTVSTLSGNPTFDPTLAAAATETGEGDADAEAGPGPSSSRVLKAGAKRPRGIAQALAVPEFTRLLRAGGAAAKAAGGGKAADGGGGEDKDPWAPFLAKLRGMSAAAIDRELRAMQVLEGTDAADQAEALQDLRLLLGFLRDQLGRANFEFCQGLLQLTLQVHGDTIIEHSELVQAAQELQAALKPTWQRVEGLLQGVRCMVSYFGNLQG